ATTAPAPNVDVNMIPETTESNIVTINGSSPPSSVTLLISFDAIPVSTKILPHQEPKITLTALAPQLSGPPYNTSFMPSSHVTLPPNIHKPIHITAITKKPIIRFSPLAA